MRLITFLGLGELKRDGDGEPTGEYAYHNTTYRFDQDPTTDIETCYVARAITERYAIREQPRRGNLVEYKINEVILLATEQAEAAHYLKITDEFKTRGLPEPQLVRVPFGANAEQQWQHFNALLEHIPNDSEQKVVFDITHGFRAQPFFAAAVINYVRSTRSDDKIPDMRILYGEYNKETKKSDIWDMSTFVSLLDWSGALQSFMKTGHGAALAQLAKKENAIIQQSATNQRPKTLARLADSIKAFSENISTVRVPQIIKGKAAERGSAQNVLARIEESRAEVEQHFRPLYPQLAQLRKRLQKIPADSLFSKEGNQSILELARLYVDYERYPEAATVLREGWVSLYAAQQGAKDDRELMVREKRLEAENKLYDTEGRDAKAGYADLLSDVRNDIQHGGYRVDPSPADRLIINLGNLMDSFEEKLD